MLEYNYYRWAMTNELQQLNKEVGTTGTFLV